MRERTILLLLAASIDCFIPAGHLQAQDQELIIRSAVEKEQWQQESQSPENIELSDLLESEEVLLDNPVNLGTIDALDLLRLNILEKNDLESLYQYLLQYGPMKTLYELSAVEGFTMEKIRLILPYVCLKQDNRFSFHEITRRINLELITGASRQLEIKEGYRNKPGDDASGKIFLGDPWKEKIKLKLQAGNVVNAAWLLKKDAGERSPDLNHPFRFDDQAKYFFLSKTGFFHRLVVGNFSISTGQGLTLGTGSGLGLGKASGQRFTARGIIPSLSMNKMQVMQGIAADCRLGAAGLTLFWSDRSLDANLEDSTETDQLPYVTSIVESNYHRTEGELEKRNRIHCRDAGLHVQFGGENWNSGFTACQQRRKAHILMPSEPYKVFTDTQRNRTWVGWDFLTFLKKMVAYGEISSQYPGTPAFLAGIDFKPTPRLDLSFRVIRVPGNFNNPYTSPDLCTSSQMNETSLQLNLLLHLNRMADLLLLTEMIRYPWLRYRVSAPSGRESEQLVLSLKISKTTSFEIFGKRILDFTDGSSVNKNNKLIPVKHYTAGITGKVLVDDKMTYNTSFRLKINREGNEKSKTGFLVSQGISCDFDKQRLKLSTLVLLFQTDSYDERIYCWSPDVQGNLSVPSFYGRGICWTIMLNGRLSRYCDLWFRYSQAFYPGSPTLGSGQERTIGPVKSEISVQLRFKGRMRDV